MSGGHFDYQQDRIKYLADELEEFIENLEDGTYSKESVNKMKRTVTLLRKAYVYAQRIDWLVSGDDSEENFHKRLKDDLCKLNENI